MSDPQTITTSPVEIPVSSVTDLPNTVIHAPDPTLTPEVPPVQVQTPPSDAPYRINTLENGQQEVTLQSGQVYRGTAEQVINELAKAQYHASRRITELGLQIPQQPTPIDNSPQIDPTAKALADLTAQGMGFRNAEEYMARLQQVESYTHQQQLNSLAANFLATTPDFPNSVENADRLDQTLASFGLQPTPDSLKMVHNHLKATGQYVQVNAPIQQQQRAPGMPLPPNGQTPIAEVQKSVWEMTPAEFEAYGQQLRLQNQH